MKYNRDYKILICGVILISAILFFQANITAITSDLYDTGVQKVPEYLKTPANITNQVTLPYTVKSISPNIMVEQNKTNRMVTLDFVTGTGSSGGMGLNGSQGPAGPQGAQGIQGSQGSQGIQGPAGINGINGTNGLPGINGTNGINGSQGPQGIQGLAGINGINGSQGPQGIQGPAGIKGINGTNGSFNISKGITLQTNATLAAWSRKKPIYINNTGNSINLSNFQVKMNISYDTDMNIDFSDIRIFNEISGLNVSYWIESKANSSYANIWINLSSLPGSVWSNSTFYMYYGNPAAASASNITNTFMFGDDFSTDMNKWSGDTSFFSTANGELLNTPTPTFRIINVSINLSNTKIESKIKTTNTSTDLMFGLGYRIDSTNRVYFSRRNTAGGLLKWGDGSTYYSGDTPRWEPGVYGYDRVVVNTSPGTSIHTFNDILVTGVTTYAGDIYRNLSIISYGQGTTGIQTIDFVFVHKYVATEPTVITGQEVEISDLWCLQLSNQGNLITSKGACV